MTGILPRPATVQVIASGCRDRCRCHRDYAGQPGRAAATHGRGACSPQSLLAGRCARPTAPGPGSRCVLGLDRRPLVELGPVLASALNASAVLVSSGVMPSAAAREQHHVVNRRKPGYLRRLFGDNFRAAGKSGDVNARHLRPPQLLLVLMESPVKSPRPALTAAADIQAGSVSCPQAVDVVTRSGRDGLVVISHCSSLASPRSMSTAAAVESVQRFCSARSASRSITSGARLTVTRSVRAASMCSTLRQRS